MKQIISTLSVILVLFSCTNKKPGNEATLRGKVLSDKVTEVQINYVLDNPITRIGNSYTVEVDSLSEFSITFPIERLATARIQAGRFYHEMCFMPGDDLFIEIEADTVKYSGKGAARNSFLYELEKNGLNDQAFYSESNKGEVTPDEMVPLMKQFKEKRLAFLQSFPDMKKLEPEFVIFFNMNTEVHYAAIINGYPRRYAYGNNMKVDSLELPEEYLKMKTFANIIDDRKIASPDYLSDLRNLLFNKRKDMMKKNPGMKYEDGMHSLMIDSLQGKTKEYLMATWLCNDLKHSGLDSVIYEAYEAIENKDSLSVKTVQAAMDKYNEKQALIGAPLHPAFAETVLLDSTGAKITFADMMSKYKYKVVYLDIWGLECGPCRAAMPHSKKLHEKLKDYPIEFVYLAQDPATEKNWEKIFEISMTKDNHYIMESYRWGSSKMLQFMEVNWVPCYMIFDKNGYLYDYNASGPYTHPNVETRLEKTLKKLTES